MGAALLAAAIPAVAGVPREDLRPPGVDVAVSGRTARALGVGAGDAIDIAPTAAGPWRRARVAQLYHPRLYPTEVADRDADIRLHLPDLEAVAGGAGGASGELGGAARPRPAAAPAADDVDSVVVRLRDPAAAPRVAAEITTMELGVHAYTSTDLARRNSSSFEVIERFHRAIGAVAVLASSVFLVTIMALRGEEMRREVGMMRLMGLSSRTVAAAVLLIAAAIAGAGLASVLSLGINAYYRRLFDTDIVFSQVTWRLVAGAAALSIALGIGAGALTAWRLLRRRPLDQIGR